MNMEICRRVESLLFAWADGALGETERAFVEAHLAGCLPCLNRSRWEQAARRLVAREGRAHAMPEGFEERMRTALRAGDGALHREGRAIPPIFRRPAFALAASALLALLLAAFAWNHFSPPSSRIQISGTLVCVGCSLHERAGAGFEICHQPGVRTGGGEIVPLYVRAGLTLPWGDLHESLGLTVRAEGRMMDGVPAFAAERIEFMEASRI
jgi:hypothetical protein